MLHVVARSTYVNVVHTNSTMRCVNLLHNDSYHGLPSWINTVTALKYRACASNDTARFITRVHPLPLTAKQSIEIQTILSLFACLFIIIPLCYAPASFVVYAVKERCVGSKHLQLVSGKSKLI
jgi:hypothetical protein